jgi:hypothetical protein
VQGELCRNPLLKPHAPAQQLQHSEQKQFQRGLMTLGKNKKIEPNRLCVASFTFLSPKIRERENIFGAILLR